MADHIITDVSSFDIDWDIEVSGYSTIGYSPDITPILWLVSPVKSFDLISEGSGGGGSERPGSGFLYPRGDC